MTSLFVLFIFLPGIFGVAKSEEPNRNEYRNSNYGYAVRIPDGIKAETSAPPNPNHGFRAMLVPTGELWVNASYTDDSSLHAILESERQMWKDNCQELGSKSTVLGALPASRMTFKCSAVEGGSGPTMVTIVVALLTPTRDSRIIYEVGFQRPSQGNEAQDQIFRQIVKDFHPIPRE